MRIDNSINSYRGTSVQPVLPAADHAETYILKDNAAKDESLAGILDMGGIKSQYMQKAVSQMKKDSVLHEYQYFVGGFAAPGSEASSGILSNDEDGVVFIKS